MGIVKILYCSNGQPVSTPLVSRAVEEIKRKYSGLELELTYKSSYQDFIGTLNRVNGSFKLAILRVPWEIDKLPSPREELNHRFIGVLVAESPRCPYGTRDVLKCFADYTKAITDPKNLEALLEKHGHLK